MEKEAKKNPSVIVYKPTTKEAMRGVQLDKVGTHVTMILYPSNARLMQRRKIMFEKASKVLSARCEKAEFVGEIMYDGREYDVCYSSSEGVDANIPVMVKAILSNNASYTFEVIE